MGMSILRWHPVSEKPPPRGIIHAEPSHLAAAPPRPSLHVPFRRDPKFVERTHLMNQVDDLLRSTSRAALVGLGGVG
jgi:hypothetical protein